MARKGDLEGRQEGQGLLLRQQGDVRGRPFQAEEPHGGSGGPAPGEGKVEEVSIQKKAFRLLFLMSIIFTFY